MPCNLHMPCIFCKVSPCVNCCKFVINQLRSSLWVALTWLHSNWSSFWSLFIFCSAVAFIFIFFFFKKRLLLPYKYRTQINKLLLSYRFCILFLCFDRRSSSSSFSFLSFFFPSHEIWAGPLQSYHHFFL